MDLQILSARNPENARLWVELWQSLPDGRRDIYFLPAFSLANEEDGRGEALCFAARRGSALLLHPFLRAPVPGAAELGLDGPAWDIQTPYGYGGPVVNEPGEEPGFLRAAWESFATWCCQAGVIAEFLRFHPLIQNERWAGATTRILPNRTTVWFDLQTYPLDFHTSSFYRNHRQMTNRAVRAGATTESVPAAEAMEWFAPKYASTQDVMGAGAETRFSPAYFNSLARGLGPRATVWSVRRAGGALARATLQMEGDWFSHGHVMAYGEDASAAGSTDLLLHDVALEAAGRGLKTLHIGGGRAAGADDALLKFKAKLAPGRADFHIGTRCHQPDRFESLKRAWQDRNGPPPPGFFLFYRSAG
jgi:hypothetical protein